jgi:hypothetical protein
MPTNTSDRPVAKCALAGVFIAILLGLALTATVSAPPFAMAFVDLVCVATVAVIAVAELRPALAALRATGGAVSNRAAIRRLRRALDELPETRHPLGL